MAHERRRGVRVIRDDGTGITRRDFLNGMLVGASSLAASRVLLGCRGGEAGSGLPPASVGGDDLARCHELRDRPGGFSAPAPTGDLHDAIVVGGGLSGLFAAWKLRRLGHDRILVLEKDDPLGGVAKRSGSGARAWAQGSAYAVQPFTDDLIEMYEDLGVVTGLDEDELPVVDPAYVIKPPGNNVCIDGAWYREAWEPEGIAALPFSAAVRADLLAFREDMLRLYDYVGADGRYAFTVPTDASTTDADIRAMDAQSLAEYVASRGWAPEVSQFFDLYCRSALGGTHDTTSAWAFANFMGSEYAPPITQPGGNAHLVDKLVAKIGAERVRAGAFVFQVQNVAGGVHVSYLGAGDRAITLRARTAVYACPQLMAGRLLPDLRAEGRFEWADFGYTPYLVAGVHVRETPPELAFDNWTYGDRAFTDIVVADWVTLAEPATADPARPNVLSLYAPLVHDGARRELLETSLEDYEELLLGDLERVLPGVRREVTEFNLYRWGHAINRSAPGFIFGAARARSQEPIGRIAFAGHEVDGLPALENAFAAGVRAALECSALLGAV